jgi:AcrR family transcriptional regulator
MARATHRRLPAEEARLRILDAAERRLREVGPEGLRLQELAKDLGISHPAILHHFGSREDLVQAVVARAVAGLHVDLIQSFASMLGNARAASAEEVLHRVAQTLADRGQARLMAWLILSGREPPELGSEVRLRKVVEGAHAFRRARAQRSDLELADTAFIVELCAFALLGDAVFGERLRRLEGVAVGTEPSRAFRARLGQLLERELDRPAVPAQPKRAPRKKRVVT